MEKSDFPSALDTATGKALIDAARVEHPAFTETAADAKPFDIPIAARVEHPAFTETAADAKPFDIPTPRHVCGAECRNGRCP